MRKLEWEFVKNFASPSFYLPREDGEKLRLDNLLQRSLFDGIIKFELFIIHDSITHLTPSVSETSSPYHPPSFQRRRTTDRNRHSERVPINTNTATNKARTSNHWTADIRTPGPPEEPNPGGRFRRNPTPAFSGGTQPRRAVRAFPG